MAREKIVTEPKASTDDNDTPQEMTKLGDLLQSMLPSILANRPVDSR